MESASIITLPFATAFETVHLPCLVVDGVLHCSALKWIATENRLGASPSTLEFYAHSAKRFVDFYNQYRERHHDEFLVQAFSRALDSGDATLGWQPLDSATANQHFNAFCRMCDWLSANSGLPNPNPLTESPMTVAQRMGTAQNSGESEMLHHLLSLTKRGRGIKLFRRYPGKDRWARRAPPPNPDLTARCPGFATRSMSMSDYLALLNSETNPRNRLLWLLLGAGGARVSEALNMFVGDVHFDPKSREALVALAHPVKGAIFTSDGRRHERRDYLRTEFGLIPRCMLPRSNPLHAGWKGMMEGGLSDPGKPELSEWRSYRWSLVEWLLPILGRLFWTTHVAYIRDRTLLRPRNPYYFVNQDRFKGYPVTRSNVTQLLSVACTNAGIAQRGPHSLRHMYGEFLAACGIPIEDAQILLRHRHIKSTQVYYKISRSAARKRLSLNERRHLLTSTNLNDTFANVAPIRT